MYILLNYAKMTFTESETYEEMLKIRNKNEKDEQYYIDTDAAYEPLLNNNFNEKGE